MKLWFGQDKIRLLRGTFTCIHYVSLGSLVGMFFKISCGSNQLDRKSEKGERDKDGSKVRAVTIVLLCYGSYAGAMGAEFGMNI